ncbi:NAD(P)H-dependent glycerol-3-phosphate dehydrogenase, partial [Candidatus Bipolaricaulota bacterium]|nr:NAD(P)H-dependent glycerol-3-phosphate dehydrogenase [Candidatus Bipolaricaulota bacterium]
MRFAVIGAGSWGTAFARLLSRRGHAVRLWVRHAALAEQIAAKRENAKYLPGVSLPETLDITTDLGVVHQVDAVVLAVPSKAMRGMVERIAELGPGPGPASAPMISLAKGLDRQQKLRMSELIEKLTGNQRVFALSGPSHAEEVGRDCPTAVVLAGTDEQCGEWLQRELSTPRFRVYLSDDLVGVELCATIKNVIALATGASDGLGYGDNSRAALIT